MHHSGMTYRNGHMFPSRTVFTVMIGRHMVSGGGPESAGDAWALSNKREQSQLLSPVTKVLHHRL